MSATRALFDLHLVSTLMLAGLIWFVQVVHYPLFARVGPDVFTRYEHAHTARTTWVVAPLMIAEVVSAVLIALHAFGSRAFPLALCGLALIAVIWISTALVQVPSHHRLQRAADTREMRRLVRSNWLRTVAWSARVPIAVALSSGAAAA